MATPEAGDVTQHPFPLPDLFLRQETEKPSIPKAFLSNSHSAFALINPETEKYRRKTGVQVYLTSGIKSYVAISYVWSEWKDSPSDRLPNWNIVRTRLRSLLGPGAPQSLKSLTLRAKACWIDCKCIDQDSPDDKAYWIPRMRKIYYDAQNTILILRGHDLTPLMELAKEMKCEYKDRISFSVFPHLCVLTQNCTLLPELDSERERQCLTALKSFAEGTWRKRAWILQEILLSEDYLLSWADSLWMRLADVGVIANALFIRNPDEHWAEEFAIWVRRLWHLRQDYGEAQFYELCDANVLQLAAGLEATVSADKYYSLCGLLRLENVQYNPNHSAEEALHTIIRALMSNGRMSWLHAVPPHIGNSMQIKDGNMAPFILTRFDYRMMSNRTKMVLTENSLKMQVIPIGKVTRCIPLPTFIQETVAYVREMREWAFPPELAYMRVMPWIVSRLSLEIVEPLFVEPMFQKICEALKFPKGLTTKYKCWLLVTSLIALDPKEIREGLQDNAMNVELIIGSACSSLHNHINKIKDLFVFLQWDYSATEQNAAGSRQVSGVAYRTCSEDCSVSAVKGETQLIFAEEPLGSSDGDNRSVFRGMIFDLNINKTLGNRESTLFRPEFWMNWRRSAKPEYRTFRFSSPFAI